MRFGNINALHLVWLLLGMAVFYILAFKKQKEATRSFAHDALIPDLTKSLDITRKKIKVIIIFTASILIIFSFMRPQWGFKWQKLERKGLDIIIAVDTSRSMLAEDVLPNRLERAKLAISNFARNLRGDRIGLIAFAGTAFIQCPLTVDYGGFLISLNSLSVNTIPRPGTSISSAIQQALKGYKGGLNKYKVLILITDGEDHEGDPIESAKEAKNEGVKIFCIGIGTPRGDLIPITNAQGNKTYLKDKNGNVVKTRLDEITLQKIALITGGSYIRSGATEFGLNLIYKNRISKMEKREIKSKMVKQYEERFQIPLFIAFLLLLGEFLISEHRDRK